MKTLKRGAKVKIVGWELDGTERLEGGTVIRPEPMTEYRSGAPMLGWFIIKFDDGGKLCVHQSRLRPGQ